MSLPADSAGNNGHASKLRRFWAIGVVAVATTTVVARQPFDNGPAIRSDGYGYHAWTYAILRGDLNFKDLNNETYAFHETRPGYWSNVYPPGVALARMPFMVWLVGRGDEFGRPTPAEHVAAATLSAIALIATSALLFYASRCVGATDLSANVAVLAVVFGTGLFHYATYDAGYSHCWTALGMSALVALVAPLVESGQPHLGGRDRPSRGLAGAFTQYKRLRACNSGWVVFRFRAAPTESAAASGHSQYRVAHRRHRAGNRHSSFR